MAMAAADSCAGRSPHPRCVGADRAGLV